MRVIYPLPVRLLTHNIRYATDHPAEGELRWECRRSRLIGELEFNTRHCSESFICLQEVLYRQLIDILSGLNRYKQSWDFVGVGRDDGQTAGECTLI